MSYEIAVARADQHGPEHSHHREDEMKLQSAIHGTDRARSASGASISKENMLLSAGVTLAFAFVVACLFMLG